MKGVLKFLVLVALPGLATAGACLPVVGTVKLVPESTCMISGKYPTLFFLGTVDSSQPWCFTTTLKLLGFGTSTGYSGVTSEPLRDVNGGVISTPAHVPVDDGVAPRQQVLTARSWLPINLTNGTVISTAEVIIIQPDSNPTLPPKRVTEQSVITSATGGLLHNATGGFVITGNSIGQEAPIKGELCLP